MSEWDEFVDTYLYYNLVSRSEGCTKPMYVWKDLLLSGIRWTGGINFKKDSFFKISYKNKFTEKLPD